MANFTKENSTGNLENISKYKIEKKHKLSGVKSFIVCYSSLLSLVAAKDFQITCASWKNSFMLNLDGVFMLHTYITYILRLHD